MGLLESLAEKLRRTKEDLGDKLQKEKEDLQRKAGERAAQVMIEKGTQAARAAAVGAGKRLEAAIFGDVEEAPVRAPEDAPVAPDAEQERRLARERETAARARDREALSTALREQADRNREIDDELAALKRKLGKR